jgi:single-stranded-DNA-specific exonuclease
MSYVRHMSEHIRNVTSLNKAKWVLPDVDMDAVERLVRTHDVPEIVARLLVQRGVQDSAVAAFLHPTLKDHFPDPFSMVGMTEMAAYLANAIINQRKIAIFGDFDVDGATSSAVFYRFLKACGVEAKIYIPDRLTEGYGPNTKALQSLKDQGAEIILMLDCGITSVDVIGEGTAMGLEILVFDHHEPADQLPPAVHIINPKRKDDDSGLEMLAAVGVVFLSCVAVNKVLRERGFYGVAPPSQPSPQRGEGVSSDDVQIPPPPRSGNGGRLGGGEPPLKQWLDIVALGTVCDMVPLTGANRLFLKYGFAAMQATNNAGLKALINVCGIEEAVRPSHAGYKLGPCINAGSRVHESDLGAKLLSTDDVQEAQNIAWALHDCNEKRKSLQGDMEREAVQKVEAQGLDQYPVIIVDGEDWHTGLSGLVAGRLKEKYKKPACVVAYVKTGEGGLEGRGSGRSIPGVHIAQGFMDAEKEGVIIKGGGHAMAGGFSLKPEQLPAFRDFMTAHVVRQMESVDTSVETVLDGFLTVRGCTYDMVEHLQSALGPFGQGNPEPLFALSNIRVHSADIVGKNHLRLMVSDWEGGARMKAMAFGALDTDMGQAFLQKRTAAFHIAGILKLDTWNGNRRVEMHVKDAAIVG